MFRELSHSPASWKHQKCVWFAAFHCKLWWDINVNSFSDGLQYNWDSVLLLNDRWYVGLRRGAGDDDESAIWVDWIKQLLSDIVADESAIDALQYDPDYARTSGCSALLSPILHRLILGGIKPTVPPLNLTVWQFKRPLEWIPRRLISERHDTIPYGEVVRQDKWGHGQTNCELIMFYNSPQQTTNGIPIGCMYICSCKHWVRMSLKKFRKVPHLRTHNKTKTGQTNILTLMKSFRIKLFVISAPPLKAAADWVCLVCPASV